MKGYTLIEILVVLFIISIIACVALLTISQSQNKQLQTFAVELTQLVMLAEEQAMLQSTVLGLHFSDHGFQFARYRPSAEYKKNAWEPLQDRLLNRHTIPDDIEIGLEVNHGRINKNKDPQIVISANGEITPFTIFVGKKGQKPHYVITASADGSVINQVR
jgi:general secretion pathway protein H